jgi:hypothetical protein
MRKFIIFIFLYVCVWNTWGQNLPEPCKIQTRSKSFEKGAIFYSRVGNFFIDSAVYDFDTLINGRRYFRSANYSRRLEPTTPLYSEDDFGNIWHIYRQIGFDELLMIPNEPFVGYKVVHKNYSSEILAVNLTKKFGNVEFTNLIKTKFVDKINNYTFIEYFKKGVGWVALENSCGVGHVYCTKYSID